MRLVCTFILSLFLTSCSSEPDLKEQGKIIFNKTHLGKDKVLGCVACHSIKTNIETVGPTMYGLKKRSINLIPNTSSKEYIKQSIINPNAYIVDGYLPGVMYSLYADNLSEKEINALVEYLSDL